jgi:pimeloyl-ACP methyl ester carboxylesterase
VNLSELRIPVAKIAGTRDGLATPEKVEANAPLLPPSTQWTWIEGGNHSQFGWYGFQPGDRRAAVPREAQQKVLIETVVAFLRQVAVSRL